MSINGDFVSQQKASWIENVVDWVTGSTQKKRHYENFSAPSLKLKKKNPSSPVSPEGNCNSVGGPGVVSPGTPVDDSARFATATLQTGAETAKYENGSGGTSKSCNWRVTDDVEFIPHPPKRNTISRRHSYRTPSPPTRVSIYYCDRTLKQRPSDSS